MRKYANFSNSELLRFLMVEKTSSDITEEIVQRFYFLVGACEENDVTDEQLEEYIRGQNQKDPAEREVERLEEDVSHLNEQVDLLKKEIQKMKKLLRDIEELATVY